MSETRHDEQQQDEAHDAPQVVTLEIHDLSLRAQVKVATEQEQDDHGEMG